MAVSKRLRFEILRRDNHACRYCGATAPEVKLTVDHVKPTALGGTDDPCNLVTACAGCNSGKSSTSPDAPLVADVEADALRWATAMRKAAEWQRTRDDWINGQLANVDEKWSDFNADGHPVPRPDNWRASIRQLLDAGLTYYDDFGEAIEIAMGAPGVQLQNRWRYFCGVCWRRAEDRQRIAREILEGER